LGYFSELTLIQNTFKNFFYFPTLLRADQNWTGLTGYIQNHLESEILPNKAGIEIDPSKTHFFLCGNPNMIESVSAYLYKNNYIKHCKETTGSLHIEEY